MEENKSQLSPQDVKRQISADFKVQGISCTEAAKRLGNISPKTLYNLLSTKQYFSAKQAERFRMVFGYRIEFLTQGEGDLRTENDQEYTNIPSTPLTEIQEQLPKTEEGIAVLDWMELALKKQNNEKCLTLLAELRNYLQAKNDLIVEMKDYHGEDKNLEYLHRLYSRQSQIMNRIQQLINDI